MWLTFVTIVTFFFSCEISEVDEKAENVWVIKLNMDSSINCWFSYARLSSVMEKYLYSFHLGVSIVFAHTKSAVEAVDCKYIKQIKFLPTGA